MKKYLLTGATGHIGINLLNELIKDRNNEIICLCLNEKERLKLKGYKVKQIIGDVRDEKLMKSLIKNDIVVIHLAGIISITNRQNDLVMDVNFNATKMIANICFEKGARLIYASSVHCLEADNDGLINENADLNVEGHRGAYEKSKALATEYIFNLVNKGLKATIVFPSAVIGPNDYKIGEITTAVLKLSKSKFPCYIKGGYSFIDVRDVTKAIITISNMEKPRKCYILSNEYISIKDLMELSNKVINKKHYRFFCPTFLVYLGLPFLYIWSRLTNSLPIFTKIMLKTVQSNGRFDNTLMKNELKIDPIDIETSLKDTINWLNTL